MCLQETLFKLNWGNEGNRENGVLMLCPFGLLYTQYTKHCESSSLKGSLNSLIKYVNFVHTFLILIVHYFVYAQSLSIGPETTICMWEKTSEFISPRCIVFSLS